MGRVGILVLVLVTVYFGSIQAAPTCQMPLVMACIDNFFSQYHTASTVEAMCRISREFINCANPVASGCGQQTELLFRQTSDAMRSANCSLGNTR